jgi:hypothetical protein
MILMRILPSVLKELSRHVPTVLFQTVEWSDLASELPKISKRMLQKEGFEELYHSNKEILHAYSIQLTTHAHDHREFSNKKWVGEKILTLYFVQLFSKNGLFLDLRSSHFSEKDSHLVWSPSNFWTKFDENFRMGLLKVYEGFYLENDELYYSGLEAIGLLKKDFSISDKKQLGDLFRAQFGSALTEEMSFNLENFKNSIIKMSDFLLSRKVNISKDFLYLGIYLVTMYSILEEMGERYPVKKIYLDVRGRFKSIEI